LAPVAWNLPKARRKSRAWIWILVAILGLGAVGAWFGFGPGKPWMQRMFQRK
jgi:hypothetical protein